jgi:tetratricopeptide (TPR) repeat protein
MSSGSAHISDLALPIFPGGRTAFLRHYFGITSFGVNAYAVDEANVPVISEHDELGERGGAHEELYFVSAGHAKFVVNGDEIDAPYGTFVFVRDPAAMRSAEALEAGTTVIVVGGKAGKTFTPSPWEKNAAALIHFGTGDYEKAIEVIEQARAESPNDATLTYNLACAESRAGRRADAIGHLREAVALDDNFAELAANDADFDAIRDDPEFASAIAGKVQAGGAGS